MHMQTLGYHGQNVTIVIRTIIELEDDISVLHNVTMFHKILIKSS